MAGGGTTIVFQRTFGSTLDEATIATLRTMARRREHPPRTVLCRQGAVEDTFFIVVDGKVVVTQLREGEAEERILAVLGPNEYFGEMALLDDEPRSATCMTIKPTIVIEVTREVFSQVVERSPAVAMAIAQRVLGTLRRTTATSIEELRKKNLELEEAYSELKQTQARLVEKEKLERELELAAEVQRTLLPKALPSYPDCTFAAYLRPARQVGGDFYNLVPLDHEHVGFVIGDVSDKGFQAALFMAIAQALFGREGRRSLSPVEVAHSVHAGIMEVAPESEVFLTAVYGVLHRPTGRFRYVRAGHEHPLLLRPGQAVTPLPGGGRFLGMVEELELEEQSIDLRPGDRLLLYSDGVTDATNRAGQMFGKERLLDLLGKLGALTIDIDELVRRVVAAVGQWGGGDPPFDDLTLLALEIR